MGLQDTVSWYQKKIGTYDKQHWERTVEQRILHGLKHVLKRTAKLKTDLIDVDLVRGSSFAKAKPKHGLTTVTKLAIIRWLFLPFYWAWWIQQTCVATFSVLLFLYVLQLLNVFVYFHFTSLGDDLLQHVSAYEVLVPAAMMLLLSLIHSEIVSTNCSTHDASTRRGIKRNRRAKRRTDKSRQPSFDSKMEGFSDQGGPSTIRTPPDKSTGLRRRTIAWGTPLREVPRPPGPTEDDGFESLNSHGSSEDVAAAEPQAVAEPETSEWRTAGISCRGPLLGNCSCLTCETCDHETDHKDTDSESPLERTCKSSSPQRLLQRRRGSLSLQIQAHARSESSCESDADRHEHRRTISSASEWLGITTNSEECSVTSDVENSSGGRVIDDHPFAWEFQKSASSTISPSCAASDRVSCTIWEDSDAKRADLSVLDISSAIIARVESMPENMDYFYGGLCASTVVALLPSFCRLIEVSDAQELQVDVTTLDLSESFLQKIPQLFDVMFGDSSLERLVIMIAMFERWVLSFLFFFLITVAERTFKQRFLYAKLFSHLTSFRRARRSELPHFRLNKVRNIKTWLSVRSYLKKRGPQRSVDVIVSAAFIITLLLLSFLSVELLKDSVRLHSEYNLEALVWCLVLGVFLLRFMTLGNKTNRKYCNLSVLLTEQINLYLQIEQKPNKKEELMVANSVLKLAADLLKELESPFKISGLSANPYLYTITKVVILSALSGVLSEMLGFKLKLHKIKLK